MIHNQHQEQVMYTHVYFAVFSLVKTDLEFQVQGGFQEESGGIPGKWRLEFRSPVECQVMRSGVRWNSRLVEPRILESGGMPGLEFWSLVKFRVSET